VGSEVTYPAAERKGMELRRYAVDACGGLCHLSDRGLALRAEPPQMEQTVPADLTARLRALSRLSTDRSA
jgi:hypothetical protein